MYNMSVASAGKKSNKSSLGFFYTHVPSARIPFAASGDGIELPPFIITADGTYLTSVSLNITTTDPTTTLQSITITVEDLTSGKIFNSDFVYNRLIDGVINNNSTFFLNSAAGSEINVTIIPIYSGEAVGVVPTFVYHNSLAKIV